MMHCTGKVRIVSCVGPGVGCCPDMATFTTTVPNKKRCKKCGEANKRLISSRHYIKTMRANKC